LDLHLLPAHNELIEQVAAANPNTVVVLAGGAPVEMHWLSRVKAVLHMGLAGQAGGLAAAELLMGAASPSGKLAQSYPLCYEDLPLAGYYKEGSRQAQYREAIYVGYRYFDKAQQPVCFPFGHGLSYTTFAYRNLVLSRTEMQAGEDLSVMVTVQNTGAVSGAEIVQLYVSSLQQPEFRPEKELKEFDKVFLQAGEEKQLTFHLNFRSFACYDCEAKTWIVPEGVYAISIAASSRDIWLQGQVVMHGTRRQGDPARFPKWYTHPSGKVTETDFERLLGRRIEKSPKPQKGGYTLNSTLRDMQASPVIRVVMRSIEQSIARDYGGANEDNPNFRMSVEASVNMPLQNLVAMSSGQLPGHIAQGLVHLANGHIWRGLKSMLGFR
jgi:beta-glucosidase